MECLLANVNAIARLSQVAFFLHLLLVLALESPPQPY